jgi:hypothetical protein
MIKSSLKGAKTILLRQDDPRSESLGDCSCGKSGALWRILVSNSCVVKLFAVVTRSFRAHMSAVVKECFPGFLVVELADVAARYSNALRLKPDRMFFSSSPA